MITFKKLELSNFLSFQVAKLDLDNQGLVLVEGKNSSSSCFDSNGAGKSALFEAFLWCLWGQTIRGYRADEVVNRHEGKDCLVVLDFVDNDGVEWKVKRARKHSLFGNDTILLKNGQVWNEEVAVQEKIDSVLGIDFKSFASAYIFYKNDTKPFSASSDAEQKKLLEKLYDLEKYGILADLAKAEADHCRSQLTTVQSQIDKNIDDITKYSQQIDSLELKSKSYVQDIDYRIDSYKKSIQVLEEKKNENKISGKVEEISTLESEIDYILTKGYKSIDELKIESEAAREFLTEKKVELGKLEKEVQDLTRKKISFEKNLGSTCPTCEQEVPEVHKADHISIIESKLKEKTILIVEIQTEITATAKEINSFMKTIETVEMEKQKDQKQLRELQRKKDTLQKELSSLEKEEANVQVEIKSFEKRIIEQKELFTKNPFDELVENASKSAVELNDKNQKLVLTSDATKIQLSGYEFFEKAFSRSGIPSLLLDSILPTLNKYAKYYSTLLSGGTIEIEFSNQTVLKSKEVREKFEIRVKNINGSDSYKGDSSGEKRRIDLCVLFALQKTAILRSKSRFNVLFMDEIFDTLDVSGIEQVVNVLEEEVQTFPSIFVISHNPELSSFFEKSILVEKKQNVSFLKEN